VAQDWLVQEALSGLSSVTLDAYARAIERFLAYCRERRIRPAGATTNHILAYLDELTRAGLRGATLLQRLTALRLFYAFVVVRGDRADNPALKLAAPDRTSLNGKRAMGENTFWIPNETEWRRVLVVAREARLRTRVMLALAYDAALRREEVCRLRLADLEPEHGLLRVRDPRGAPRREVALSPLLVAWCVRYVGELLNRSISDHGETALFLSESSRNRAEAISIWTWSKVVASLAAQAEVPHFTPHTLRHLRLADLARAGWSAADIASFAGHSRSSLAQPYLVVATTYPEPQGNTLAIRAKQLADFLLRAA
jgi:site-specific recombinase XerD